MHGGDRAATEGELVLIDAAAGVKRYACDVTRTFPAGKSFTPEQRDLYALVLAVESAAVARCVPGAEMVDIHEASFLESAKGLIELGFLRGTPEGLRSLSNPIWA